MIFQKERKATPKIGDTITPKNRRFLRGEEKYIQWNEILREVLNGKLTIVENKRTGSESESEEKEIEEEEKDFENHDTSERDGCYRTITTSSDDEKGINFHTYGKLNTGEIKTENIITEKKY